MKEWSAPSITTEEIIELGEWPARLGVQVIDLKTNESRTLQPGEVVELKPGRGFSKKHKYRRGYEMSDGIDARP